MRTLLIASLAALSACAANANPASFADAESQPMTAELHGENFATLPTVSCDVRATRTARGVRFEATAFSNGNAVGDYEFVIAKRDRAGRSDIVQGGEFDLVAGETASLGSAEVSVERGASYTAQVVMRDADGVACSAERTR